MPARSTSSCKAAAPAALVDFAIALQGRDAMAARRYGARVPGTVSPLVLHFHGGAFTCGGLDASATVGHLLAAAGAVVVSLAYPLAPRHPFPEAIEAGYLALEWLYGQRTKLAGRDAPLFLAGEEAGGNLAAALAVIARDRGHPPLAGQILLSPMLDPCTGTPSQRQAAGDATQCRWAAGWHDYLRSPADAVHPYAAPGAALRLARLPPALVLVGADDPLRDEALAYAARLRGAGIAVTQQVLASAVDWPEALYESGDAPCVCAVQIGQHLRDFFAAASGGTLPPPTTTPPTG